MEHHVADVVLDEQLAAGPVHPGARTLYVCADNAGHPGLQAWARGLQSLIAYWAGRPQEAVRYARGGAEIAADLTGSVSAWLPHWKPARGH